MILTVVAMRLNSAAGVAKGSKVYLCSECHLEVWLAPSSQKLVEQGAGIICLECLPKKGNLKVEDVAPLTDEQRKELREFFGYDPKIDMGELLDEIEELRGGERERERERREMTTEKVYFCPEHYREFAARWGGDPSRAYPGQKVEIDAARCSHWDCVTGRANRCPWCGRPIEVRLGKAAS